MTNFPVLSAIVFVPLLGALGALLLPRLAGWGWALLAALVDLALALSLIPRLDVGASNIHMLAINEHLPWLPDTGISYTLSADGINLFLLSLNALLTVVAVGASLQVARSGDRPRQYVDEFRHAGRLSGDQPLPLLRLLGGDAGSGVSAGGHVRRATAQLRGDQVRPLYHRWLAADAHRHHRHWDRRQRVEPYSLHA